MQRNVSRMVHLDFYSEVELEEFMQRYSNEAPPTVEDAV